MNVLNEILRWSSSLPTWQRDALRRLMVHGSLSDYDVVELTEICKATYGLSAKHLSDPLQQRHIPTPDPTLDVVTLSSITHHVGVNALASEQTIEFGPGLTIVYGDNAAGKSGYTRILKRACRARGAEEILGNVLATSTPGRPSATIRFKVGDKEKSQEWSDRDVAQHALGNVSVFDGHCASVYLREKTDVAFRPFGLDIFDKLSKACEDVRTSIEKERSLLEKPTDLPKLSEGTAAYELVSHLSSLTKPDDVRMLANLSEAEKERQGQLRRRLKDLESDDPKKTARALTLRAQRLDTLASDLENLTTVLSDVAINSVFEARDMVESFRNAVETLHTKTFSAGLLPGSGSDLWRAMWEAARHFSTAEVYPDKQFPVTDAKCLLCQQALRNGAPERLQQFADSVNSTLQQKLDRAISDYGDLHQSIDSVVVRGRTTAMTLEELQIDTGQVAASMEDGLSATEDRRAQALTALAEGRPVPNNLPVLTLDPTSVSAAANSLRERATEVLKSVDPYVKDGLLKDLRELEDRATLGNNIDTVLNEIERQMKLAAYELCRKDTNTRAITLKSSEVTKAAVTKRLSASFQDELANFKFTHLEVNLQEAGGVRGTHYHKLVLKRATGVELPRVVSEGEARTLSIAAFFAELSTSSGRSAILFDDPVSSLDHNWRENVARRLTAEAKLRQVVVFTHNVTFLVALVTNADEVGTQPQHQYLRREHLGAGMSSSDLPWIAMNVKARIGTLNKKWQDAEKLFRTAHRYRYDHEAKYVYGLLREAWERALEEIMLGGVVQRYRRTIQTQQIKHLSDITEDDCSIFHSGMTKSSRWLPGHDQSPAENVPVPEPDELKADINTLDKWVRAIRDRRH